MKLRKWVKVVSMVIILAIFILAIILITNSNKKMIKNCIKNGYNEEFCIRGVNR